MASNVEFGLLAREMMPLAKASRDRGASLADCKQLLEWVGNELGMPDLDVNKRIQVIENLLRLAISSARTALGSRRYTRLHPDDDYCLVAGIAECLGAVDLSAFNHLLQTNSDARRAYEAVEPQKGDGTEELRNLRFAIWMGRTGTHTAYNHRERALEALVRRCGSTLHKNRAAIQETIAPSVEVVHEHKARQEREASLLLERSTIHLMRTLESKIPYVNDRLAATVRTAIETAKQWHQNPSIDPRPVVRRLDDLSHILLGKSVYEIIGSISVDAPGPAHPPHEMLPWCNYPRTGSLVLVPGGVEPFTSEKVAPFFIARYPVTMHEWHEFMVSFQVEPSRFWREALSNLGPSWFFQNRAPAVGMTFYDCIAYCFWLWATTPYRFRLPTEAEWNFAASGGSRSRFPWGDTEMNEAGRYSTSREGGKVANVDELPPVGPYWLSGMSGNVWEYTASLWQGEEPVPNSDIPIPDLAFSLGLQAWWKWDARLAIKDTEPWRGAVNTVIKGGSFSLSPSYATTSSRAYSTFGNHGLYGGVRLAVSAIRNPATGDYRPEGSPLVDAHLSRARLLVEGADFRQPSDEGRLLVGDCPVSLSGDE